MKSVTDITINDTSIEAILGHIPSDIIDVILTMSDLSSEENMLLSGRPSNSYSAVLFISGGNVHTIGRYDKARNIISMQKNFPEIAGNEDILTQSISKLLSSPFNNAMLTISYSMCTLTVTIRTWLEAYGETLGAFQKILEYVSLDEDGIGNFVATSIYKVREYSVCYEYVSLKAILNTIREERTGELHVVLHEGDTCPVLRMVEPAESSIVNGKFKVENDVIMKLISFNQYKSILIDKIQTHIMKIII